MALCAVALPATNAACFTVVQNCPAFPVLDTHCQGNVLYACTGPTIINDQAVFDWVMTDCTQTNNVCKVLSTGPTCVPP